MSDSVTIMEPYREEIPVQKEVSVVIEDPNNPGTYIQTTEIRTVMENVTLYKPVDYERYLYYNVSAILTNFIAGQLGVSVVNWYYDYSFVVQTGIDEALMAFDSVEDLPNRINVKYTRYTWKHVRLANENGTNIHYVLSDIITETPQGAPYNYTVLLQYVFSVLFYADNAEALGEYCTEYFNMSEEDSAILFDVLRYFNTQLNENNAGEQVMSALYSVISLIFPYTQDLANLFENSQYGLIDIIEELPNVFEGDTSGIMLIISDIQENAPGDPDSPLGMFGSIIQLLKEFFAKIKIFFDTLFAK